jgi:hypothetical protein
VGSSEITDEPALSSPSDAIPDDPDEVDQDAATPTQVTVTSAFKFVKNLNYIRCIFL